MLVMNRSQGLLAGSINLIIFKEHKADDLQFTRHICKEHKAVDLRVHKAGI